MGGNALRIMLIWGLLATLTAMSPPMAKAVDRMPTGLQLELSTTNTTMTWQESRVIVATVLFNGTPVEGALVQFRSAHRGEFTNSSSRTAVDGMASTVYSNRRGYYPDDVITASVEYANRTAGDMLNITIVDPPPTIIPGANPRSPGPITIVWLCSAAAGITLFLALAAAVKWAQPRAPGGS